MKHGFLQKEAPRLLPLLQTLNSQLAKYATVILPIPNVEHADFKVSTFSSQLAIEYILNVLIPVFLVAISIRITHHKKYTYFDT